MQQLDHLPKAKMCSKNQQPNDIPTEWIFI